MNSIYTHRLMKCSECGKVYSELTGEHKLKGTSLCCNVKVRRKPKQKPNYIRVVLTNTGEFKKIDELDSRPILIIEVKA